jgi:hypothetical protein
LILRKLTLITCALAICASAQTVKTQNKNVARTKDGHPDLTGIWTNITVTPLERPKSLTSLNLTEAEAKAFEKEQSKELSDSDGASDSPIIRAAGSSGTGGYNVLFLDRGNELARVDGQKRSSLISDPPDGHVPPTTPDAHKRLMADMARNFNFDDIKNRPVSERCLLGFGSTSGPPMLPVLYNNNYQIIQTPDTIMILVEMVHDVRFIHMDTTKHLAVNQWLGDSIGHWEGDTLVVETTNFNPLSAFRGGSSQMKVTERFTAVNPSEFLYKATIEDPDTWTKPFTLEFPFNAAKGPIYEYACHEGNYAATDIMGGARKADGKSK